MLFLFWSRHKQQNTQETFTCTWNFEEAVGKETKSWLSCSFTSTVNGLLSGCRHAWEGHAASEFK